MGVIGPWEFAILFMIALPVLLGLGIVFAIAVMLRSRNSAQQAGSPLETLEERYARGEIDSEEFEERRRRLAGERQP